MYLFSQPKNKIQSVCVRLRVCMCDCRNRVCAWSLVAWNRPSHPTENKRRTKKIAASPPHTSLYAAVCVLQSLALADIFRSAQHPSRSPPESPQHNKTTEFCCRCRRRSTNRVVSLDPSSHPPNDPSPLCHIVQLFVWVSDLQVFFLSVDVCGFIQNKNKTTLTYIVTVVRFLFLCASKFWFYYVLWEVLRSAYSVNQRGVWSCQALFGGRRKVLSIFCDKHSCCSFWGRQDLYLHFSTHLIIVCVYVFVCLFEWESVGVTDRCDRTLMNTARCLDYTARSAVDLLSNWGAKKPVIRKPVTSIVYCKFFFFLHIFVLNTSLILC